MTAQSLRGLDLLPLRHGKQGRLSEYNEVREYSESLEGILFSLFFPFLLIYNIIKAPVDKERVVPCTPTLTFIKKEEV